jgi:tellurite resistance protein TerC
MNGVKAITPFLLVVLVLGTTDVVFAIDSIPTVFGITDDPFIVWSSNAMAVLGMRPLFFLLVGMVRLFRYLQYGLAAILGFVGLKMIVEEALHDFHVISELGDIYLSLGIIVGILTGSVLLSIILPGGDEEEEGAEAAAASDSGE